MNQDDPTEEEMRLASLLAQRIDGASPPGQQASAELDELVHLARLLAFEDSDLAEAEHQALRDQVVNRAEDSAAETKPTGLRWTRWVLLPIPALAAGLFVMSFWNRTEPAAETSVQSSTEGNRAEEPTDAPPRPHREAESALSALTQVQARALSERMQGRRSDATEDELNRAWARYREKLLARLEKP